MSKVRGTFTEFSGDLNTTTDPTESTINVSIKASSTTTGNEQRDGHVRSADFFAADEHPTMTFTSTAVAAKGDHWVLTGDLTIKDVTKSVDLTLEANGFGPDAYGGTRAGFSATTEINRKDFNVNFNATMETGGVVVSDKVTVQLEIEAVLRAA